METRLGGTPAERTPMTVPIPTPMLAGWKSLGAGIRGTVVARTDTVTA